MIHCCLYSVFHIRVHVRQTGYSPHKHVQRVASYAKFHNGQQPAYASKSSTGNSPSLVVSILCLCLCVSVLECAVIPVIKVSTNTHKPFLNSCITKHTLYPIELHIQPLHLGNIVSS